MKESRAPTKVECELTAALSISLMNLQQLYADHERLAADNDHIPDPMIESAIFSTIALAEGIFQKHERLDFIYRQIMQAFHEAQNCKEFPFNPNLN